MLFVVSRSLTLGPAAGVGTAVGGQLGVYAQVAAVAFGIGAIVERSMAVFTAIKLAGAAYLVYLGVQAVPRADAAARAAVPGDGRVVRLHLCASRRDSEGLARTLATAA